MMLTGTREERTPAYLVFVLFAGFALRLYNLGVPSQWMDEILVPLNASHPIEYILELSRRIAVHSPFFYGLIKTIMLAGSGDSFLRLPSALAGVGTIYLVFKLGTEIFDKNVGLYAAVFIALNPHHLFLSRFIRPYSLVVFLFCISLLLTWRAVKSSRMSDCLWLLAVDCLMLLMHSLAALVVGVQILYWCAARIAGKSRIGWGEITLLASGTAALSTSLWFLFLRGSSVADEFFTQPMGLWESFKTVGECFLRNLFYFDVPWAWALGLVACIIGLVMMWLGCPWAAFFVSAFLMIPPLALVVTGMAWNLWARHLSPMIPVAALTWAVAAASIRLTPQKHAFLAVFICLVGSVAYLGFAYDIFYTVDSYRNKIIGTNYKVLASKVQAELAAGDVIVVTHDYFRNGINWYADRLPQSNLFRSQTVESNNGRLSVHVLADMHYGYIAKSRQDFINIYNPGKIVQFEENVPLFTFDVERSPEFLVDKVPQIVTPPMDLRGFYERVWSLKEAVFFQDARGPFVMATRNNALAEVEYAFANMTDRTVPYVILNFYYRNVGKANHVSAEAAFDDEAPKLYLLSMGPDAKSNASVVIKRDSEFKTLKIRLKMVCAPLTPLFPGGNYETLRFEGMEAAFCLEGEYDGVAHEMNDRLQRNSLRNFLAERFFKRSHVVQRMVSTEKSLANNLDELTPGWSRLEVAPENAQGIFLAELEPDNQKLVVYPRVGGESSVGFYQLGPDGKREELLVLHGVENSWTPISAQYPIKLDSSLKIAGKYQVEILLQGRWAQVWNKSGTIFFDG